MLAAVMLGDGMDDDPAAGGGHARGWMTILLLAAVMLGMDDDPAAAKALMPIVAGQHVC